MVGTVGRSGGDRRVGYDRSPEDHGPERPRGLPRAVAAKWNQLKDQLPANCLRRVDVHELKLLSELLAMADDIYQYLNFHQLGEYKSIADEVIPIVLA